jgi:hypothetical protein
MRRDKMKIAVTAENNLGLESVVAQHFGHVPYFVDGGAEPCADSVEHGRER